MHSVILSPFRSAHSDISPVVKARFKSIMQADKEGVPRADLISLATINFHPLTYLYLALWLGMGLNFLLSLNPFMAGFKEHQQRHVDLLIAFAFNQKIISLKSI